jgi:hypothetical protein
MEANFNKDGKLSFVHVTRPNNNMVVARTLRGDRETVGIRPGGVIAVTQGRDRGYVQRPIPGRAGYVQRTYLVNGQPYAHVYRAEHYHGVGYYRYVPARYYSPRFYDWVRNPWPGKVTYNWGRAPSPAMGFYSGYFTPAPSYPSAALWLTDFVMAANLKTAYQNHQEFESSPQKAGPSNANPFSGVPPEAAPVSPEVKEKLAQEVQAQVEDEQAAAAQPAGQANPATPPNVEAPPPALAPNESTFVVSQNLDVSSAGAPCTLTPGDIIQRAGSGLTGDNKVGVNVASSKAGDCPANSFTQIDLGALQEMSNQLGAQIDAGLSTLAQNQTQDELPPMPAADPRPSDVGTAQPDHDVVAVLEQQQADADTAEGTASDSQNAVASM